MQREEINAIDGMLLDMARRDPNAFMSYVLRDERTGRCIEQAPMHESWQDEITKNDHVVLWSSVESGKSSQITVGRTLYELGRDTSKRIVIVSNTYKQSEKLVGVIAKYIESSSDLRRVFPDLLPADPWTNSQIFVKRKVLSKDPSLQACGVHGSILGARIDWLVLDDVLDYENCRTQAARQDLWEWFQATLVGRLTEKSKIVVVGTAFHPEDMLHKLATQPGWRALKYPVLDPETGLSRWPKVWPMSRIEKRRQELIPIEFARQMLCVARDDADAVFKREWIDVALKLGNGKDMVYALESVPPGCGVFTGVDLAVQQHSKADLTVLFTIMVHPDGTREVLCVESGRIAGPDIVKRIVDTHNRFHSIVIVENVAAQDYIVQFTRGTSAVPVIGFTTGSNKVHPEFGVQSLGAEMMGGKWVIPNRDGQCAPEISAWISEMLYYDPNAHTGDRIMASWFAREGARKGNRKIETRRMDFTSR